jgi:hypothetical protein
VPVKEEEEGDKKEEPSPENGAEAGENVDSHKNQSLNYYKRFVTNKIFKEEYARIKALSTKTHFLLYGKHCPIKHYQSNAYHIKEAFGQEEFDSVALIHSLPTTPKVTKKTSEYNPFADSNKIFSKRMEINEYGYSTKFSNTTFPFTLKTLVCSLLTALQYTQDHSDKLTKLKIFKSILYSFSRSINHEEPNKGKGLGDKRPFIPKPFITKVQKWFPHVIELEFFNENLLQKYLELVNPNAIKKVKNSKIYSKSKNDDPLNNVLADLQKKLDRVFKINERLFEDNWNQSAEELISFLNKNFGFQNYKNIAKPESSEEESEESGNYGIYGKMQDDSEDEEEEEEEEAEQKEGETETKEGEENANPVDEDDTGMFDFDKEDLQWRVDQQLFEPLREIFGFRDTREED